MAKTAEAIALSWKQLVFSIPTMKTKNLSPMWIVWILFVAMSFIVGLVVFSHFVPPLA